MTPSTMCLVRALLGSVRAALRTPGTSRLRNLALRQQLALLRHRANCASPNPSVQFLRTIERARCSVARRRTSMISAEGASCPTTEISRTRSVLTAGHSEGSPLVDPRLRVTAGTRCYMSAHGKRGGIGTLPMADGEGRQRGEVGRKGTGRAVPTVRDLDSVGKTLSAALRFLPVLVWAPIPRTKPPALPRRLPRPMSRR